MSNTVAEKIARGAPANRADRASLYAADGGRKYLNRVERSRALAAMADLDPDKALFALTMAWTGARVSEVLGLTHASFQVESSVVGIRTLKRRRFIVREVPIPPALMKALDTRFGLRAAPRDPTAACSRLWPWHRVTAWRIIKGVMRRADITGRPSCPRGLRHGFGVGTLQAAVPLNLVQRWLGHARLSTTAIYTEAMGPEEQGFAARFWEAGGLYAAQSSTSPMRRANPYTRRPS